jgi:integrase/recombinase XerD
LELCQRVLSVPFKRARSRPIEYLEFAEIQAVLTTVNRTTADGHREYALLATMFNTGARVQEIVTLSVDDLRLHTPPHVRLFGKGRKERLCPLWPQTGNVVGRPLPSDPLFRNCRGARITRFGVRYILKKHCARARLLTPTLAAKRLHPQQHAP